MSTKPGRLQPEYWVPAVADETLEPPPGADAFAKAVYGEVRDRYDRLAVAEDVDARFDRSDRAASERRYVAPLVAGRLERQRRSWSPSISSPAPTPDSARALVVEVHRSRVAELFEIACCRATGRIEDAKRLARRREQIEGAADAVEAGVRKTQPLHSRPEYWVPAVADETLEPPPGADAFAKAVYGEVRDRYDRRAVAEDRAARFDRSDRAASERRYLDPLVAGRLERQRRSWSPSISSPAPTPDSARALVVEVHRSRVAELFEIACCRATGRIEDAKRLARRREQIEGAADAVEAGVRKTQPLHSRPEYWVPAVADETLESPPGADAFAKAVYGEVRDRYDRRAVAEDRAARFDRSDRAASERRYLAPLVAGRLERQRRSWSPSISSPAPTPDSARALVVEVHRSRVAELFEIACCRATGRIEDAKRLARRREQIEGAADAVEAGVRKTQPLHSRPEYWVPAVADETLESPPGADAFAKAVYGEVRDRYDRRAVAEDRAARFDRSDRAASERRYLAPLVAGRLERQRRSWSPSISSPAPTPDSARALVVEVHRSRVAELFEIACCRATGRIEDAKRLARRREQIEGAADAVEAGVPKTQPLPDSRPEYCVPALADETLESPPGADAFAKAVYGEVRDRYDRCAVAEDRDARFDRSDRASSEQRHLDALVAETLERQRQAWNASERESSPEREEIVRKRIVRECRSAVQGIFLAACQESRRGGALSERRPDRVSAPPPAIEREPRRETVHAISGTGFDASAGDHEGGRPSPRPKPSEHRLRRAPTEQTSPSSAPATPAMPAAAPKAKGAAANRGTEADEPDGPGRAHPAPVKSGTGSRSSPKPAKDTRGTSFGR